MDDAPINVPLTDEVILRQYDVLAQENGRLRLSQAAIAAALRIERDKVTELERRLEPNPVTPATDRHEGD